MNRKMNILKMLAIVAMVIGHSRGWLVGSVYLYHMMLFIFVSGYFYNDKYSLIPKELIIKRFKSLYIPFLKFNLFILIFKVIILDGILLGYGQGFFNDFRGGIKNLIMFNSTDPLISGFWFLKNLFIINIIFVVVSYISIKLFGQHKERARCAIIVGLFIIFFKLTMNGYLVEGEISYLSRALVLNIFFYMGFMYKKYEEKFKCMFKIYLLIPSIIYILLAPKFDYFDTYYFYFVNIPFFLISASIGIYLNIYIANYLDKFNYIAKIFDYIGKNSLWILAYHLIAFKFAILLKIYIYKLPINTLSQFPTYVHSYNDWILDAILGVVIPILLCLIYSFVREKVNKKLKKLDTLLISNKI